jgi:hypothetical protein
MKPAETTLQESKEMREEGNKERDLAWNNTPTT